MQMFTYTLHCYLDAMQKNTMKHSLFVCNAYYWAVPEKLQRD